ncbi:MAG: ABC transporter substrate-binding protein [Bacillota bacterium]|nr:ABC transporter substrate-binding protein [Bacillota bacterium]
MKKILALLLTLAFGLFALAGCGGDESADTTNFVFATTDMENMDPAIEYQGWGTMRYGVGETLFKLSESLEPEAFMADDYQLSDDQLTWTITIKDGIVFHNGNPVDGNAVKSTLERLLENNDRAASDLMVANIEADGQKVMITTTEPNPTLINSLCDPYACIVDASIDTSNYSEMAIGTGPYKVVEYIADEQIKLEPNTDYWNGDPKLDSLTIRDIPDASTLASALESGEINAAYGIPYDSLERFKSDESFKVSQKATSRVFMIYFNMNDEFIQDKTLRDAISMAVDKEALANVVLAGAGTATKAAFPSNLSYGNDEDMTNAKDFDLEGAKQLLADNGYIDSDNDGILEKDGKPVELKMVTYTRTGLPQQAEAVQSGLRDLGLSVSYELVESAEDILNSGDFSLAPYAYVTAPTGDPLSYLNYTMGTDQGSNFGKYSNSEIDAKLREMSSEFDPEKRSQLAVEIQQLALADSAYCYMTHLNMALVMGADVVGLEEHPSDYYIINVDTGFSE